MFYLIGYTNLLNKKRAKEGDIGQIEGVIRTLYVPFKLTKFEKLRKLMSWCLMCDKKG
jgi:hypothetical protein